MRAALAGAVAALVLLGAGCSDDGGSADAGSTPRPVERASGSTPGIADTDDDALFTVDCTFSHRAADDPIVFPDQPGASHSHDFFGSAAADASSTGASLQGTATTCEDTEDTASYWTPTLSVDGEPVDPTFLRAYYRARPGVAVADVTAPPLGLAMIAGDPARGGDAHGEHGDHGATSSSTTEATGAPAPTEHDHGDMDHGAMDHGSTAPTAEDEATAEAGWGCGLRPRAFHVEPPTDCTDASPLTLRLRYPDCWDGENLDSPDHRSHVARSVDGDCPASHPVLMTELQVSIVWPVTGDEAAGVTLSSGGVAGAHGDFLNGWDPEALADHVDLCVHAEANCTVG